MSQVRVGIIGLGSMGNGHARYLVNGEVPGAVLAAVCDRRPERLEYSKKNFGEAVATFDDVDQMMDSGQVDAVLVSTPHYAHPELSIKAFEKGLHVMVEKPAGVYTKQVREMNEAAEKSGKVFGIMFCVRQHPVYQKVRHLVQSGQLGELKRVQWTMTTHYRPQSYYNSGSWRGTWAGEGGGVLINQLPHQLDLFQWIVGVPKKVRAFCSFGKYHEIEVDDDVTAYMEFENGATGVFIGSTGEAPGTDRLEIVGNQGKLVLENDQITFWRLEIAERDFNNGYRNGFGTPQYWKCEVPVSFPADVEETMHRETTKNWVNAILHGKPLLAPGEEGINSLQLSNAMHLSTWLDNWVDIPVDEEVYIEQLEERNKSSVFWTREQTNITLDVNASLKK